MDSLSLSGRVRSCQEKEERELWEISPIRVRRIRYLPVSEALPFEAKKIPPRVL